MGAQDGGDLVAQPLRLRTCSSSEEGDEIVVTPMTSQPVLGPAIEENAHFPAALDYASSDLSSAYASGREDKVAKEQLQDSAASLPSPPVDASEGGGSEVSVASLPTDVQDKDRDLECDNEKDKSTPEGTPRGSDAEDEVVVAERPTEASWQTDHDHEKEAEPLSDQAPLDTGLDDQQPLNQEEEGSVSLLLVFLLSEGFVQDVFSFRARVLHSLPR